MLVAAMRLGFIVVFACLVVTYISPQTRTLELALIALALFYGAGLFAIALHVRRPWVSWVSKSVDVSLVTVALLVYAIAGDPWSAVNNRTYFDLYFFIIVNATLRYDWRLCAFTTFLVLAQFLGITGYVRAHWAALAELDPFRHGVRVLTLAATGVTSVAVARWARHLRLMVGTDHLTGLSQRRPFLERIEEELQRSHSSRASLSIALLDFDEFKKFNDSHGHMAGDLALQLLAARLRKSVRSSDLVARFGGEEFVIAFPRMDVERAIKRVNELREELGSVPIPVGGATHYLTVSAGVGCWPADGETFEKVLAAVDERLYAAKASGRNCVIGPRSHLRAVDV